MPFYSYEAVDKAGLFVTGTLEAEHEQGVARHLRTTGYIILDVVEIKESPRWRWGNIVSRVELVDLDFFSRQLAAMLEAGIPLSRCLFMLYQQTTNPVLRRALGEVARNVESGNSLSESLRSFPAIFTPVFVAMVKAGEASGSLAGMLSSLSAQLGREKILRDQMRSATLYPLVILSFSGLVVLFLIIFLVPVFKNMLPLGMLLPLPTRIIFGISDAIHRFWYLYLALALGGALGLGGYLRSEGGQRFGERVKIKLPVFGPLVKKAAIVRFTRVLALLLSTGIPILKALETAGSAAGSVGINDVVKKVAQEIEDGRGLAVSFRASGYFPPLVVNLMAVGEETGRLPNLLDKAADFYEEELAALTKGLVTLIEPVLIIAMGFVVGGIIVSIYLPLFLTVTTAGG